MKTFPYTLSKEGDAINNGLWLPSGVDLSSAWVGAIIVRSNLNAKERRL